MGIKAVVTTSSTWHAWHVSNVTAHEPTKIHLIPPLRTAVDSTHACANTYKKEEGQL